MLTIKAGEAALETTKVLTSSNTSLSGVDITSLPTENDVRLPLGHETRSTFHIYQKNESHKCISPAIDPSKERLWGPTVKEQRAKRKQEKQRQKSPLPLVDADDNAFFLHRPYLAFHMPPRVLYVGNSKQATPAVLIHTGWFWGEYKLQIGPSIATHGVLDPRGVVAWKHNGGDKKALRRCDKMLKGYKVRNWRPWGETGAAYVRSVRKAGTDFDPDVLEEKGFKPIRPVEADEFVYLRWTNPVSRHPRRYHFRYASIDFYWKGTGTVKESRTCGLFLRFNHLKLVARLPATANRADEDCREVCLGRFTSSIACKKNGTLEFFDAAILRLVEEHAPKMLTRKPFGYRAGTQEEDQACKIPRMKRRTLYQVLVATGMCMIISEKEKRHILLSLLAHGGEGAGGAGG